MARIIEYHLLVGLMSEAAQRGPGVWIISSEQWPRAMIRAELIERGYDAAGYLTIDEALIELMRRPAETPRAIILDLNGMEVTQSRLSALTREGVPVVILGGAIELGNPTVGEFSWAGILKRPFTIDEVAALIEQIAPRLH